MILNDIKTHNVRHQREHSRLGISVHDSQMILNDIKTYNVRHQREHSQL